MAVESDAAAGGQATGTAAPTTGWPDRPVGDAGRHRGPSARMVAATVAVALVAAVAAAVVVWTGPSPVASRRTPALPPPAPNDDLGRHLDPGTAIGDPDVVTGRHLDYLYSSAVDRTPPYLPVRTFRVLGRWIETTDAMPTLPAWAAPWLWNPDVRYVDGRYVMWFTAPLKGALLPTTRGMPRCLGWATSSRPLGPFVPAPQPAICQVDRFGAIDPQTLVTPSGQEWLYWKSDSNAVPSAHMPTVIWAQKLARNGVAREGHAVAILSDTRPWEGTVVESPQMVRQHGRYYLFFSGNVSGSTLNGIGVAPCRGPGGPCTNAADGPWLGGSPQARSVGEESLFSQDGATWLLYAPQALYQSLMLSRVAFGRDGPYVASFDRLPSVG